MSKRESIGIALLKAAQLWIEDELDQPKPDKEEASMVLNYLKKEVKTTPDYVWYTGQMVSSQSKEIWKFFRRMVDQKPDISKHFNSVSEHRKWVKYAYDLFLICLPDMKTYNFDSLRERINHHDMSKYGPNEALGYHFKFSSPLSKMTFSENNEWLLSLDSHYQKNSHHPEFHSETMMGHGDLVESVIDMIACRLERNLKTYATVCPVEIFAVKQEFLTRYKLNDGEEHMFEFVVKMLVRWARSLEKIVNYRMIDYTPKLDQWEQQTGLVLNDGNWIKLDPVEVSTGFKIKMDGNYAQTDAFERDTGYNLDAGDWVKDWQLYVIIEKHSESD